MDDGVTRRGLLQLFAVLTATVPVLTRRASNMPPVSLPLGDDAAIAAPAAPVDALSRSRATELESYLRSRGVRPVALAREAGYARVDLLRIRMGRAEPTPACAVAIVYALRRLVGEQVVLTDLFPPAIAEAAWRERRAILSTFHPFEHRAVRAILRGRR